MAWAAMVGRFRSPQLHVPSLAMPRTQPCMLQQKGIVWKVFASLPCPTARHLYVDSMFSLSPIMKKLWKRGEVACMAAVADISWEGGNTC